MHSQVICMGYYDNSWDKLPKKVPYDALIIGLAVVIHLVFPVPIYFYRKREEKIDQAQQHHFVQPNNCIDPFNLYFKDLILNYFIILLMFINSYIVVTILNK